MPPPPSPALSAHAAPLEPPPLSKRVSLITSTSVAVEAASLDRYRSRSIGTVIYARSSPEFAQLCGVFNAAQAEVLDLKSNPEAIAAGVVIEAKLEKGRGQRGGAEVVRRERGWEARTMQVL